LQTHALDASKIVLKGKKIPKLRAINDKCILIYGKQATCTRTPACP
jgi:hypothetical protein